MLYDIDAKKVVGENCAVKTSIKSLADNISFDETSEEDLKGVLARATAQSTRFVQLVDSACEQVAYLLKRLAAKCAVVKSILPDWYVTLGSFFRDLIEDIRTVLISSICYPFFHSSIEFKFHVNNANDGIALRLLGAAMLEEEGAYRNAKGVVDPAGCIDVFKFYILLFIYASINKQRFLFSFTLLGVSVVFRPTFGSLETY